MKRGYRVKIRRHEVVGGEFTGFVWNEVVLPNFKRVCWTDQGIQGSLPTLGDAIRLARRVRKTKFDRIYIYGPLGGLYDIRGRRF